MIKKIKQSFGDRIKELRLSKNWSQVDFSKKIGSNNRQISNYEKDKIFPNSETLIKMASVFEMTIDYLVTGEITAEAGQRLKDKELLELFKKVEDLDDTEKNIVKNLIDAVIIRNQVNKINSSK